MKPASYGSTSGLPFLQSELTAIAVDLEDLTRRVRQLAERIALASGEVFSGESAGGNNGKRPSLLSNAAEILLALPTSREDAAVRRRREAIHLLDRVAGLQEDAERVFLECPASPCPLARLEVDDFRPEDCSIIARHGKRRKQRTVYLSECGCRHVKAWLGDRGYAPGPLFCPVNQTGGVRTRPLREESIAYILRRRQEQAGSAPFSPHDLRW